MRLLRMLGRTLSESIVNIFRHGWLSVSAILSITVTLLLTSVLLITTLNVENVTQKLAQGLTASVYIEKTVSDKDAMKLADQIKTWDNILDAQYSTANQEFDKLMETYYNDNQSNILIDMREVNPLPAVITVTMEEPDKYSELETKLKTSFKGKISDIVFSADVANNVLPIFDTIRNGSYALIFAVGFVAIILISNTIRITIVARRTEIGIMRLVAASNWYIRTPFIIEGILLGVIGAFIATGISVGAYSYYFPLIENKLSFGTSGILVNVDLILKQVLLWTVVIGGVIGLVGSFFPVRKYLKK